MSKRYKNNHYHYAEKFDPRNRRMRASDLIKAPKKAVTLAILFLLTFGLISTTFAAYVSSDDFASKRNTVLINARNTLAQREGLDGNMGLAQTGADMDLASLAAVTDLRYNSDTKGWGTNSSVVGNSSGYIPVTFSADSDESFKIYHDGWSNAYFSKSTAAVSLNTEYTLDNNNDHSNMTCSFAAGTYAIKIGSPDTYNGMKMTIYRCFDADSHYYLDAGTYWDKDNPVIGAYFCDGYDGTATWVKATPCNDKSNSHVFRVTSPSTAKYTKIVWGRFKTGTTQAQMSFTLDGSGGNLWNQTVDQYYQAPNTVFTVTSTGTGTDKKATVSISSSAHTHKIYAYEAIRDTENDDYVSDRTVNSGTNVGCTSANIPALTANSRTNYTFDGWYRSTTNDPNDEDAVRVSSTLTLANDSGADKKNYAGTYYYFARYTLNQMTVTFDDYGARLNDSDGVIVAYGKKPAANDIPDTTAAGYTFQYWDCNSTHYTNAQVANTAVTADRIYTAKYNIDAPTVSISNATSNNINYEANNSTPLAIGGTVSSNANADDITLTGVYAWDDNHTADQPADYLSNTTLNVTTGAFTASMPGVYYLKYTGTVTNTNTLNGYASTTVYFTVTVLPEVPTFDISLFGKVDDADMTGVDRDHAWMVLLGAHYHFEASVSNDNSNYTYEWSKDGGTTWYAVNSIPSSWTAEYEKATAANSPNITINTNTNGSVLTFADNRQLSPSVGTTSFSLKVRATKNGVSRSSADVVEKWFFIERLIHSYRLMPMHQTIDSDTQSSVLSTQKIFSLSTAAQAGLEAIYSTRVDYTGYTTYSKVSVDNLNYTNAQILNQISSNQTLTDLTNTLNSFLTHEGVKYLKLEIQKGDIEDGTAERHTTVGTANESAVMPYYFIDGIAGDTVNGRVMAFWADSNATSGFSFQTAQDVYRGVNGKVEGVRYRVNLPHDVTKVVFAVARKDYYGMPTYNSTTQSFEFSSDAFSAITDNITVSEQANTFTFTAKTADSLPKLTGTTGAFVPES